jgi:hypothetical protein
LTSGIKVCITQHALEAVFDAQIAHQRDIQDILRAYLDCRRRDEPASENQQTVTPKEDETPNLENTGQSNQDTTASEMLSTETVQQEDIGMEDTHAMQQEAPSGTEEALNPTPNQEHEPKDPPYPAEARSLLTRLAVLVDEWLQNCEEKVNLAKAAYNSVCHSMLLISMMYPTSHSPCTSDRQAYTYSRRSIR